MMKRHPELQFLTIVMVSALAMVTIVLALTGCGKTIDHGTITERNHRSGYTSFTMICQGSKPIICNQYPVYHPESWELCMSYAGDDGKPVKGCRDVDQHEYEKYKIGQVYP